MSEIKHTPEESNHYLNALDILNDGDGDYKVKTIADLLAKVEEQGKEIQRLNIILQSESEHAFKQVSEQQREIEQWKNVAERRAIEPQQLKKELSEQSQRIQTLESENGSFQGLIATLEEHIAKLEEALREALPYMEHLNYPLFEKIEALLNPKQ